MQAESILYEYFAAEFHDYSLLRFSKVVWRILTVCPIAAKYSPIC
ncbi:hypothetical protein [Vibrio vulnificus YJ016]|uniref:Uncharacterized protein n=1 Tax=Vibrio vulnificus (strain YJ016) TaxID=196600 RepID=Q7MPC0_VIBVY|nr:hypothetical protein [Vibrio vulnificus YJ016]